MVFMVQVPNNFGSGFWFPNNSIFVNLCFGRQWSAIGRQRGETKRESVESERLAD